MIRKILLLIIVVTLTVSCPSPVPTPPDFKGPITGKSWTIMYYLAAENSLESALISDFKEIAQGQSYVEDINVVVFIDRDDDREDNLSDSDWTGTRVYHVNDSFDSIKNQPIKVGAPELIGRDRFEQALLPMVSDNSDKTALQNAYTLNGDYYEMNSNGKSNYSTIKSILTDAGYLLPLTGKEARNLNAASGDTLFQYASFVKDNFISDHYMISFGSHANGWFIDNTDDLQGMSQKMINEDNFNGTSSQFMEIYDLRQTLQYNTTDLLFTDACSMADIESAYEFSSITDYICYSQVPVGGAGLDYVRFYERLGELPSLTSVGIITEIIEQYKEDYSTSGSVDLSSVGIDTGSNLQSFITLFQDHAENTSDLTTVADNMITYVPNIGVGYPDDKMIDLKVLLDNYGDPVLLDYMEGGSKSFIVYSYSDTAGLNGVSIYKPDNTPIYEQDKDVYAWTRFAIDYPNGWISILDSLF
jgi:hypothetical protein